MKYSVLKIRILKIYQEKKRKVSILLFQCIDEDTFVL